MHKYLGVVLDEHLNFKEHVKYVVRKINKKVNYLGRIGQDLTKWCKRTIYKTIIEPHLTYCSSLLLTLNESDIQNLQMAQNRALRIILSTNRYASVGKMLRQLNILSVKQIIMYNVLILIHRMTLKLVPPYLTEKLTKVKEIHQHFTRYGENYVLEYKRTSAGQNTIFYKGLNWYNQLNSTTKNLNLKKFKKEMKKVVINPPF